MSGEAVVLQVAAAVASQPTVPFLEHLPRDAVRRLATEAGLPTKDDAAGNLVVGRGAELVLVAHLDHPGFAVEQVEGSQARLGFRGGVRAGVAVPGTPVLLHSVGHAEPIGRAVLRTVEERDGRLKGAVADVVEGEVRAGGFAVWDVTTFEVAGGRVTARACDDLLGVAAGLAALVATGDARASLLCTRAEEVGWYGALEAVRLGTIPAGATVLSLECSPMLPAAPQGGGVIVRVGDLRSVFDPGLTGVLWARARALASSSEAGGLSSASGAGGLSSASGAGGLSSASGAGGLEVAAQRRLMDGGSCEATVFCARGLRSSGLALPLAGYHNQPDDRTATGPVAESVLVADLASEEALLRSLCEEPPGPDDQTWLEPIAGEAAAALADFPL